MSKPLAFGLILFFLLIIVVGLFWLLFFSNGAMTPGILKDFFPVAGERDRPVPGLPGADSGKIMPDDADQVQRDLIRISDSPIGGFSPVKAGVRYIERATGHVFESSPDGRNKTRISGTTIPGVFDAVWSNDAGESIIRYREEDSVRTASVKFSGTTTVGVLLPESVISAEFAPDRKRIVYLAEVNETLVMIAADPNNTKQSELARLPFADFTLLWPTSKIISLATKPSGETDGYLFGYNLDTGALTKIAGPELGLEARLSASGKKALLSSFRPQDFSPRLEILDVATKNKTSLQTQTLTAKCAWSLRDEKIIYCAVPSESPKAIYPDSWYKGEIEFNDVLWSINIDTLEKKNLIALPDVDVGYAAISPGNSHIYFYDKKEGHLWSYKLPQ